MSNITLIESEKLEAIENELSEIKSLILQKKKEEQANTWLTKTEARKRLKVCQKTLDNYLSKKVLPFSKFAGKVYLKASDIEAHLQKHYIN